MKTAIIAIIFATFSPLTHAESIADLIQAGARSIVSDSQGHFEDEYAADLARNGRALTSAEVTAYQAILGLQLPQDQGLTFIAYDLSDCVVQEALLAILPNQGVVGTWYVQ